MQEIKILSQAETILDQAKITTYKIKLPIELSVDMGTRMGFDCGTTHIGLAQIKPYSGTANLFQILMVRNPNTMFRIKAIQEILGNCELYFSAKFPVIIEGAAFGANYRQTELAEIRTSAALWFAKYGGECYFVPPRTIRKQVFGNGNMLAHKYWDNTEIRNDALAALACSYYQKET